MGGDLPLRRVYNNISNALEASSIDITKLNDNFFGKNYNLYGKDVWKWLVSNSTTVKKIEDILRESIGRYGRSDKYAAIQSVYLRMYLAKLMKKSPNVAKCEENCEEIYSKMSKIWLKGVSLTTGYLGLGTLYRHFAPNMGITHRTQNIEIDANHEFDWLDVFVNDELIAKNGTVTISYLDFSKLNEMGFDCNSKTENEASFHLLARTVGKAISGFEISLYDYPNYFKVEPTKEEQARPILTYPIYSWCKHGSIYHRVRSFAEFIKPGMLFVFLSARSASSALRNDFSSSASSASALLF